jgi:hypothetical protein
MLFRYRHFQMQSISDPAVSSSATPSAAREPPFQIRASICSFFLSISTADDHCWSVQFSYFNFFLPKRSTEVSLQRPQAFFLLQSFTILDPSLRDTAMD